MADVLRRTTLHEIHTSLKAKMVPFAGWEMPVQYGSILAEARAVRSGSGIFDVSHMGRLVISGPEAHLLMDLVVTADASNLRPGRARYAMICNEAGGIVDDVIFYRQDDAHYLLVCNASNREQVISWLRHWSEEKLLDATVEDRTEATAMIAIQGPAASAILKPLGDAELSSMRPFTGAEGHVASKRAYVGRTGYTGEDGFEIILAARDGPDVWRTLMDQGAVPCGLGARDVLRLEAGLALHGNDIDTSITPLEAGLERYVRLDKQFIGVEALRRQKESGVKDRLVGLVVNGKSVARAGYPILIQATPVGEVTSGTSSPTLDMSIAMGYVLVEFASPGRKLAVDIRGRVTPAEIVPLPFYSRNATQ